MLRLRSNCSVMLVLPWALVELIDCSPAIVANCFSSGRAIDDARRRVTRAPLPDARQGGVDLNCRVVDGRQVADRKLTISQRAEDQDAEHQKNGRDRTRDEDC